MTTRKARREAGRKFYHNHSTERKASATAWKRANRAKWNAYMRRLRARKKLEKDENTD